MKNLSKFMGLTLALSLALVASCGGGGSAGDGSVVYIGAVTASSVDGATVELINDTDASVIDTTTTDANGNYSFSVASALTHRVRIKATGGTYLDEATATTKTLGSMELMLDPSDMGSSFNASITPMSEMISKAVAGGQTLANARTMIQSLLGVTVDHTTLPVDANATTPVGATMNQKKAGFMAAVFSQMASTAGCTHAQLLTDLGNDLGDGTMDMAPAYTCAITDLMASYKAANLAFLTSPNNKAGASFGNSFAFNATATSANNTYVYSAMMDAMQGKHMFSVTVTDGGGAPVTGGLGLMPKMYMTGKMHAAPHEGCVETNAGVSGVYNCTIYYLMPSTMNGMNMGIWELSVTAAGETVKFYPSVMMGMGDSTKVELKGIATGMNFMCDMVTLPNDDCILMMGMNTQRRYQIFLTSKTVASFGVFVSTMDTMMSFPAVAGQAVEYSKDSGATWAAMADDGLGHYSANTGLAAGTHTILVRLIVGTEVKTQDGKPTLGTGTAGDPYTQGLPHQSVTVTLQ